MNDCWIYQGKCLESPPEGFIGFTYIITNISTGQKYIGKKLFFHKIRKKITGRKNRKLTIKSSDWEKYYSSSDELVKEVATLGKDNFVREVLAFYPSKKSLSFAEVEEQIKRNVLTSVLPNGKREYYNKNIMGRYFYQDVFTEEHRRKIGQSNTGIKRPYVAERNKSEKQKEAIRKPRPQQAKNMLGNSNAKGNKDKPKTEIHKERIKKALCRFTYEIITPSKIKIETTNLTEFCKENKISQSAMVNMANGKRSYYKGYSIVKLEI